jgi:uncharacterized integral membrane protein
MKPKQIVILVLAALCLIVLLQNTHVVNVDLFFWTIHMSVIVLGIILLAVGFILGYIAAKVGGRAVKKKNQSSV